MCEKLNQMGLYCAKPEGSFYLLPRLPSDIMNIDIDDLQFARKLAEVGVLVVPGSAFGVGGYIRIAALPSPEEINAACILMQQVLQSCRGIGANVNVNKEKKRQR